MNEFTRAQKKAQVLEAEAVALRLAISKTMCDGTKSAREDAIVHVENLQHITLELMHLVRTLPVND